MKKTNTILTIITALMAGSMLPGFAFAQTVSSDAAAPVVMTQQQLNLEKAKTILSNSLDLLEKHFETTRQKAVMLQNLSQITGADIAQTLDEYLAQIQSFKQEVANDQTSAELKATAQKIHLLIQNAKQNVKKNVGKRVSVRIAQFTQRAKSGQALIQTAQTRLNLAKSHGKNTDQAASDLQSCQNLMSQGNQTLQTAQGKFDQMQNLTSDQQDQVSQLMTDGLALVKQARGTYEQARQSCSAAIQELRTLR